MYIKVSGAKVACITRIVVLKCKPNPLWDSSWGSLLDSLLEIRLDIWLDTALEIRLDTALEKV